MPTLARPLGYTGSLQRLVWTLPPASMEVYLWGAGGGGGGDEGSDDPGGNGSGGGFTSYSFFANTGDIIDIAVGKGGTGGFRTPGSSPGIGGDGLVYQVFNTRLQSGVVPVSDPRWSAFMNAHAVWDPGGPGVTPIFRSYTVNFPITGNYVFQFAADDSITVTLDGTQIINYGGFQAKPPALTSRFVTAGNHTINITGGNGGGDVAGIAMVIDIGFSGANGGSGSPGSNGGGSGGGGGAATVLLINGSVAAVAGGGAGGGGAGGNRGSLSPDAPGPWGYPPGTVPLAQDGQSSAGRGGGGGGGGGGQSAGNGGGRGGATPANPSGSGDLDASAGSFGQSVGQGTANPSGRDPGGRSNQYYSGSSVGGYGGTRWASGNGQNGTNGSATVVMDATTGFSVRFANLWQPVKNLFIREQAQWRPVKNMFVKRNGQWQLVYGTSPPTFGDQSGGFGRISRASI